MNKKRATRYFNELYDSTYDDALTYIAGKSGDTDIANDVLFDTYATVYAYLLKQKEVSESDAAEVFYNALNDAIEKHRRRPSEESTPPLIASKDELDPIIDTELDLSEQKATDDMLIKKAHSFVLQRSGTERKAFILYFYEGYSAKKTAKLLGLTEDEVYGYLVKTVSSIQSNFLAKYISK